MARNSARRSKPKAPRRAVKGTKKKQSARGSKKNLSVRGTTKKRAVQVPKKKQTATAGSKRSRPLVAGLKWTTKAPRLRTAAVPGGQYVLVGDGLANWTAEWRPAGGRVAYLVLRTTDASAQVACERHYIETQTDAMLVREGAAELTDPGSKGAATTWKKRR